MLVTDTAQEDLRLQDDGEGYVRSGEVRFYRDLAPLMRDIDSIAPAPYNYNQGDVELIQESIEDDGMYRPVFVQASTKHIVAGNHTWMAVKGLGSHVIPVVELDVDDTKAKRMMVKDNEIARKAQPDQRQLLMLLNDIEDAGQSATHGTGVTEADLEVLRKLNEIDPDEGDDFAQWPTFSVRLPPHVLRGFMALTDEADDDRQRFELLLRMAGWDG